MEERYGRGQERQAGVGAETAVAKRGDGADIGRPRIQTQVLTRMNCQASCRQNVDQLLLLSNEMATLEAASAHLPRARTSVCRSVGSFNVSASTDNKIIHQGEE
jgi:hypothetical protein